MTTINNFEELKSLPIGDKFYVIHEGDIRSYWLVGAHPKSEKLLVSIWDADYTTAKVFSNNNFSGRTVMLRGKYDSAIVGKIMIDQLKTQVKSIKSIYLEKEVNHQ